DLAGRRPLDEHGGPVPPGPAVGAVAGDLGDLLRLGGAPALRIVPNEQLAVTLHRPPCAGASAERHPPRAGDLLALAVAAPAPVVEGAGDPPVLDGAPRQIAAHVSAVGVQRLELAVRPLPDDQLSPERQDLVRLAVPEVLSQPHAVPATGESLRIAPHVDLAYLVDDIRLRHHKPPWSKQ